MVATQSSPESESLPFDGGALRFLAALAAFDDVFLLGDVVAAFLDAAALFLREPFFAFD
jgi:hypothetical protein